MKSSSFLACCTGNGNLDPEYVEDFVLPRPDPTRLENPFTLKATHLEKSQQLYSELWKRKDLEWDFKYLAPSLGSLENQFKELPRYLRVEWIVQVLVLIKELKHEVHFRKVLFLILGMFLDTRVWPAKDVNFLYSEFLRKRIEEAELSIAKYCRFLSIHAETTSVIQERDFETMSVSSFMSMDQQQNNSDIMRLVSGPYYNGGESTLAELAGAGSSGQEQEHVSDEQQQQIVPVIPTNTSSALVVAEKKEVSTTTAVESAEFGKIAWAYELKHICEYKLRDFVTKDETKADGIVTSKSTRFTGFLNRLRRKKATEEPAEVRRAKPVLLEVHDGMGNIVYRKKDVDTTFGFKESLITAFELEGVPDAADLFEVFCDARKTVQKIPFTEERELLQQCGKMKHFHYYVYKPHSVEFLDNLGAKLKKDEEDEIISKSTILKGFGGEESSNRSKILERFQLVSDDLQSTYSQKYVDFNFVAAEQQRRNTMFGDDDEDAPVEKKPTMKKRVGLCMEKTKKKVTFKKSAENGGYGQMSDDTNKEVVVGQVSQESPSRNDNGSFPSVNEHQRFPAAAREQGSWPTAGNANTHNGFDDKASEGSYYLPSERAFNQHNNDGGNKY